MRRAENKQRFAVLGQGQASGQAKLGSPRRKVNWGRQVNHGWSDPICWEREKRMEQHRE